MGSAKTCHKFRLPRLQDDRALRAHRRLPANSVTGPSIASNLDRLDGRIIAIVGRLNGPMIKLGSQIVGAAIALLIATAPVHAQEAEPDGTLQERTEKALREGVETMMDALKNMLESIPLYEAPEELDNGDIIIRRKKPDEQQTTPDDQHAT